MVRADGSLPGSKTSGESGEAPKPEHFISGAVSEELGILIWENFRSSIKDGVLLILGGIFTAIFLIVAFGVFLSSGNIPQVPGIPEWILKLQGIFTKFYSDDYFPLHPADVQPDFQLYKVDREYPDFPDPRNPYTDNLSAVCG